jgi:hypothetical protein
MMNQLNPSSRMPIPPARMTEPDMATEQDAASQTQILTALSTEYFGLSGFRASTVFEANGRIAIFLTTASSFVVALAFVGQASGLGRTFYLFASILLPTLFALGVLTYMRVLQTGVEDLLVTRAMARIRSYFIGLDKDVAPYYLLSGNDDHVGHLRNMGIDPGARQLPFTAATMVAILDSVVAGVFIALAFVALGSGPVVSTGVGLMTGAVVVTAFLVHESARWRHAERSLPVMFPSQGGQ